ncbi:hypothetical protein MMC26_006593 [Xylographa opegraphella]|nr:hypothetical protein [Xylographa opegraphella]
MQLPTASTLLLLSLTLTTRTTLAYYDEDYNYGLEARDLYARSAAAEVYNDIMGLAPRHADPDADDFPEPGLFRRETLQECYTGCLKEAQKTRNAKVGSDCRKKCAENHPGQALNKGNSMKLRG